MMNMSYCRFENTYKALEECLEALQEQGVEGVEEGANTYERPYIQHLINLCEVVAEEFGNLED